MKRIFLLVLFSLLVPTVVIGQPIQWTVESGGNGHFYELVPTPATWYEASDSAQQLVWEGMIGHLATLVTAAEDAWCQQQFAVADHVYWPGGTQIEGSTEPSGGWYWITDELWDYAN